ncbi:hypothetical protein V8C44DRAFT_314878 [Trichoderma aethiopicum]
MLFYWLQHLAAMRQMFRAPSSICRESSSLARLFVNGNQVELRPFSFSQPPRLFLALLLLLLLLLLHAVSSSPTAGHPYRHRANCLWPPGGAY